MAGDPGHLLDRQPAKRQQGHPGMPQLSRRPVLTNPGRLTDLARACRSARQAWRRPTSVAIGSLSGAVLWSRPAIWMNGTRLSAFRVGGVIGQPFQEERRPGCQGTRLAVEGDGQDVQAGDIVKVTEIGCSDAPSGRYGRAR